MAALVPLSEDMSLRIKGLLIEPGEIQRKCGTVHGISFFLLCSVEHVYH